MKWLLRLFGIGKLTPAEQEAKALVEAMREREREEERENRKHDFLLNVSAPRSPVPPVAMRTSTTRSTPPRVQVDTGIDYIPFTTTTETRTSSSSSSSCGSSYSSSDSSSYSSSDSSSSSSSGCD